MNQEKTVLNLIYAGITGEKANLGADFSLEGLLPFFKKQEISAICYYGAVNCGVDGSLPEMQILFKQVCAGMAASQRQDRIARELYDLFDREQFAYMPVKGLLLRELYPAPEMRLMGDLDILIKLDEYPRIRELMLGLGYIEKVESDHELIWNKNGVMIELHKRLIPSYNKDYYAVFGDGWQLGKICTGTRYAMTDEDQMVYQIVHFAKHYRDGGIGLRHMVDLYLYRRSRPNLNEEEIAKSLTELQLLDFYKNIFHTLDVWFAGVPADAISDLITKTVFGTGLFGSRENHILSEGVKMQSQNSKRSARGQKLLNAIFLPYKHMCKRYPVLERLPVLLPVMWVVRWVTVVFTRRKNIKKVAGEIQVMQSDALNQYEADLAAVGLAFRFDEE